MTDEARRWERVKATFQAALDQKPEDRPAYLDQACGTDRALRAEVNSLLEAHGAAAAGDFAGHPAIEALALAQAVTPSLVIGQRLAHYQIEAMRGVGGMGVVYKARDTRPKLDRTVAIKVLPPDLRNDPTLLQRFEREGRILAALNHQHVCTVFDVGQEDGIDFLVMEYLAGETLAARLAKGPLKMDDALRLAIQIASALDAAHRAGIVHRDLKPGNVMLTKNGAQLLDFGLARATVSSSAVTGPAGIPSMPRALTTPGAMLGTVEYMAPEQIEGYEADPRTDLFAFGIVLYEMLTGKKPFTGQSQAGILGAILKDEPSAVSTIEPNVPLTLDRVVKKCLAKDPGERWQTAKDLGDELKWVAGQLTDGGGGTTASDKSTKRPVAWGATAALALVAALLAVAATLYIRRAPADNRVYRSSILPPSHLVGEPFHRLAISPDGRRLAFAAPDANGHRVLWVRALDDLTAQPLAGTDDAIGPFWSPDSRVIAFFTADKHLKKIDASGGPVFTLCEAYAPFPGAWSRNGVILFTPTPTSPISRVSPDGGPVSAVTMLDVTVGEASHSFPFFLPDGRHFLYTSGDNKTGKGGVYIGSLDSPSRTRLLDGVANAQYALGHLLFLRGTTLMAQPLDLSRLTLTGKAVPLAEHLQRNPEVALGAFSVSDTGVIAFQAVSQSEDSKLVWYNRSGQMIASGERNDSTYGNVVTLSPDGSRAAVIVSEPHGVSDIWIIGMPQNRRTRFTFDPPREHVPVWSPDGDRIAFDRFNKVGGTDLYEKASSGVGNETVLLADRFLKFPQSWSGDGRFLLYSINTELYAPPNREDLWVLPLFGDRKPFPFLQTPFKEMQGQFSPDGRWIAYVSNESGSDEVYVAPFSGTAAIRDATVASGTAGGKWQVSKSGGTDPRWRRDGKEIFYLAGNTLMSAAVTANGVRFEAQGVQPLFDVRPVRPAFALGLPFTPYDVSPDGQRFLVNSVDEASAAAPVTLVVNWPGLLNK